ncbi:DUF2914 domain-containing protein [Candidatus Uhrbacteria bacterium]|jgi:hypothetical protein|nr:DUF2914 domain-containing protein [Candidatus Uhrbacteria bacterium]MBT7717349.1 DUF2914 domain-containing protein [Candidatus Uhrbacteria bacterium]
MQFITKLKQFYKANERILIPTMLIFGVIVDFVTFRTIKISSAFIVLAIYWLIAGATIIFIHRSNGSEQTHQNIVSKYYSIIAPLVIQFTFGATLSASFIFYWFSGSFSVSWPFMFLIAILMIANEAFRKYYMRPMIQVSVYYFITLSLITLMLPYLFNSISAWIFALGGILSLMIGYLYLEMLASYAHRLQFIKKRLQVIALIIFGLMNLLYFTNLIPPIPLSLTEAGVYHHIERSNGGYILEAESQNLLEKMIPGEVIHVSEGEPVYVYSAIFAPFDLNTQIIHEWQHFDNDTKRWVTKDELGFTIYGGRDEGYRGFSQKSSLSEGFWRVNVQTSRGQTIGVVRFKIRFVDDEIKTEEVAR